MKEYLLDTNICIYIINNKPEKVYKQFKKLTLDKIHISPITEFELRYGVEKSQKSEKNLLALNEFLQYLKIIPFESKAASIAGNLRNKLEKKGEMIGAYDLLIASQAIASELTLVTNHPKEFKKINELKLENWI